MKSRRQHMHSCQGSCGSRIVCTGNVIHEKYCPPCDKVVADQILFGVRGR